MSLSDNAPVGWTNPNTGAYYARNVEFRSALDNYQPVARNVGRSLLEEWRETDGSVTYVIVGWKDERDALNAIYLVDDGRSVRPYYVAGWSQYTNRIFLHPFPTEYRPDGERRMRADDSTRPVDFSTWMSGPKRAYHLKLTEAADA